MTSFEANEVDVTKEILDRTRADDEFWDQVSELALLDDTFVGNECSDHIAARFPGSDRLSTVSQRSENKFTALIEEDEEEIEDLISGFIDDVGSISIFPEDPSSYYSNYQRRLRLMRKILISEIRNRARSKPAPVIAVAPPSPVPPPASPAKSVLATSTAGLKSVVAQAITATLEYDPWESLNSFLSGRGAILERASQLPNVLREHSAAGELQAADQKRLDTFQEQLTAALPNDAALSALLRLGVGRASIKPMIRVLAVLLQGTLRERAQRSTQSAAAADSIRLLSEYRLKTDFCAPLENAYLGSWRYHTTQPTSKRRPYSSVTNSAVASDGTFLYVINKEGFLKIGSGFGGSTAGQIYKWLPDYRYQDRGWLVYVQGKLLYRNTNMEAGKLIVINPHTMTESGEIVLQFQDREPVKPQPETKDTAQERESLFGELPFLNSSNSGSVPASTAAPSGPPANVVLTSEGRYIYLISEIVTEEKRMPEEKKEEPKKEPEKKPAASSNVPPPPPPPEGKQVVKAPPQPITVKIYTYKLQKYDPQRNFERVGIWDLQGTKAMPRHDQIVCEGCQRACFSEPRWKCSTCSDYSLCQPCKLAAFTSKSHKLSHTLTSVPIPEKDVPGGPALSMDAMLKGTFIANGRQLAVIMPSGVNPNPLRRRQCARVFSLRDGAYEADVCVDLVNNGIAACFDPVNELIWTNTPDSWLISRWRLLRPPAGSTDLPPPLPTALPHQTAASLLLNNLEVLCARVAPCKRALLGVQVPAAIDLEPDSLRQLVQCTKAAVTELLTDPSNRENATNTRSLLRILWSHLYHLTRLGSDVEKFKGEYEVIFSDLKPSLHTFIKQMPPSHGTFYLAVDVMVTMLRYPVPTPSGQLEYASSLISSEATAGERALLSALLSRFSENGGQSFHLWPPAAEEISETTPLGRIVSFAQQESAKRIRDAAAETRPATWSRQQAFEWFMSQPYTAAALDEKKIRSLDGAALLALKEENLYDIEKDEVDRATVAPLAAKLLTEVQRLRLLDAAHYDPTTELLLPSELRLLLSMQRDLFSRPLVADNQAQLKRVCTYASWLILQCLQVLETLFPSGSATAPLAHSLRMWSLLNAVLPAALVAIGLLNQPQLARSALPHTTKLLLRLDAIRAAHPMFFNSPAEIEWLCQLEQATLQLVAQHLQQLTMGEAPKPEEQQARSSLQSEIFLGGALEDPALLARTAWLKTFVNQPDGENATPPESVALSKWMSKRGARVSPLPPSAEPHVARAERAAFAAGTWLYGGIDHVQTFANQLLSNPLTPPPPFVTALYDGTGVSGLRAWLTNRVRQLQETASVANTPMRTSGGNSVGLKTSNVKLPAAAEEVTDEKLAGQLVQTALALLQLLPLPAAAAVPTPAQVEVLLQPMKLLLPAACISEAQSARLRRAQSRSFAFESLAEILPRLTNPQSKRELLRALGTSMRGQYCLHYLEDVVGGGLQAESKLTASFLSLAKCLASNLTTDTKDLRLQVLLLNALCQRYRPEEAGLLRECQLLQHVWNVAHSDDAEQRAQSLPKRLAVSCGLLVAVVSHLALRWPADKASAAVASMQDLVLQLVFSQLQHYCYGATGQKPAAERIEQSKDARLNDHVPLQLLSLLYRLRKSAALQQALTYPATLKILFSLIRLGTPRLQRICLRLLRHIFGSKAAVSASAEGFGLAEVVSGCFAHLGELLSLQFDYSKKKALRRESASGKTSGDQTQYAVMMHHVAGNSPQDVVKLLAKMNLPKFRPREVALEASEVGLAVAGAGTHDECVDLAKKLTAQGMTCSITKLSSRSVSNEAARRTPAMTPHAIAASASELIALLRIQSANPKFAELIRTTISAGLQQLPSLCARKTPPAASDVVLQQSLATLALSGAFVEPVRIGGRVRVPVQGSEYEGVVIEFVGARSRVLIEYKDDRIFHTVDTNALQAIPERTPVSLVTSHEATARLAEVLAQPATELWQHMLRALALQALSSLIAAEESAAALLKQGELLPRLLQWAKTPSAEQRTELLRQRLELQQLLHSDAGEAETTRSSANPLPYRVGEALPPHTPVPTHFDPSRSTSVFFPDVDLRRAKFCGKDGEDVTVSADVPIPDVAAEFYFEVRIESPADSKAAQVQVGLCPAQSLPGYGPVMWMFSQTGTKAAPLVADATTKLFTCPYCQQEELSGRELCTHARQRHAGSSLSVVCPICASTPFGDPGLVSANFFQHIQNRHNDLLKGAAPKAAESEFGGQFAHGDVIGCGWLKSDGSIFFTKNGFLLGTAFVGVQGRFVPAVRLLGAGSQVHVNFGQQPFVYKAKSLKVDDAAKEKLKKELETKQNKAREEQQAKQAAKVEQATLLQAFVGFPIDFCMVALEQTAGNVEAAASWALENFERYNSQAVLAATAEQVPAKEAPAKVAGSGTYYLGDAYRFPEPRADSSRNFRLAGARVRPEQVAVGMRVVVSDAANSSPSHFSQWVDAMDQTMQQVGKITEIDTERLLVRVQFQHVDHASQEQWWYPMRALNVAPSNSASSSLTTQKEPVLALVSCEEQLAGAYAHDAIENLLRHWPSALPPRVTTLGGFEGLSLLLQELARAHLSTSHCPQTTSSEAVLSSAAKLLRAVLPEACDWLWKFSEKALRNGVEQIQKGTTEIESDHPYQIADWKTRVGSSASGVVGLLISFDKRTRISSKDTLGFYADEAATQNALATVTGTEQSAYLPITLPHSEVWIKFTCTEATRTQNWGWRIRISPLLADLHLSLWLLEHVLLASGSQLPVALLSKMYTLLEETVWIAALPEQTRVGLFHLTTAVLHAASARSVAISPAAAVLQTVTTQSVEVLDAQPISQAADSEGPSTFGQNLLELTLALLSYSPAATVLTTVKNAKRLLQPLLQTAQLLRVLASPTSVVPQAIFEALSAEDRALPKKPFTMSFIEKAQLTESAKRVFTEVFKRFDADKDGALSPKELDALQLVCQGEPLGPEGCKALLEQYEQNSSGNLTLQGFLQLYFSEAENNIESVGDELLRLGYNPETLQALLPVADMEGALKGAGWSRVLDEELVAHANTTSEAAGLSPLLLSPHEIHVPLEEDQPHLRRVPLSAIRARFALLRRLNAGMLELLPWIDLSAASSRSQSLASEVFTARALLFYDTKMRFFNQVLDQTATAKESPSLRVDRVNDKTPVFLQLFSQLRDVNPLLLRQKQRAFKVQLRNERVEGDLGPYREVLSQICMELESPLVSLLIPCPNKQLASQTIGVGENRDKYVLKPSAGSPNALAMFELLGRLIGIAIRTKNPLNLDLPAFFWKPLVGEQVDRRDLAAIDHCVTQSWVAIQEMDKPTFEASVFETFECTLSDGTRVPLKPDGANLAVTYENRLEYLQLSEQCRLAESSQQIAAVLRGLCSVVPRALLCLPTWVDLALRVCGKHELDLQLLRRHTRYRAGVNETDPHVLLFWRVLENFTNNERRLFLRFAWGRERLPPEEELQREELKIFPLPCKNPDQQLPQAETCFFTLKLPKYSTLEIAREKLLYAIIHTRTIDGDMAQSN